MKNLVVTLVIGEEIESLAQISAPLMQKYAKKIGADFKVLGATRISENFSPYYEKLQISDFFSHYSRVVFVDADILISPLAPDIFRCCPTEAVGVVSVEGVYQGAESERLNLQDILGPVHWQAEYFNSGVFVVSAAHKDMLNLDDGLINRWIEGKKNLGIRGLNDQSILNYRASSQSQNVEYLDTAFNFTRVRGFEKRFSKYFIHYAGFKNRRRLRMKIDYVILSTSIFFALAKKSVFLVKVLDRVAKPFVD